MVTTMQSTKLRLALTNDALGSVDVAHAVVREALSTPTTAHVTLFVDDALDEEAPIGTKATLKALVDDALTRTWDLVVIAVRFEAARADKLVYSVELAHPLALLAHQSDVRMYQKVSVQDIVDDVVQRATTGLSPAWHLKRSLSPRTYCVQYRETDLDFVSRLLEHEGIFYVPNDGDGDGFTLADDKNAFAPIDGNATVAFVEGEHGEGVHELDVEYSWVTDRVTLRDWNHETPTIQLQATSAVSGTVACEAYEFPGGFSVSADGGALAQVRAEELASRQAIATGRSDQLAFRPARSFTLSGTSRDPLNADWVLRSVTHSFVILRLEREDDERSYSNTFVCAPSAQPYRPSRDTPRPIAAGSDSVVVTGPSGEEIHTDSLGRMTGKFYWDRIGKNDETSSRWMRVVQLPIGGSMALARMKWEMVVRYLYGDPDRPIAIARVDNGVHAAPYAYPAAASAMSLKTLTSPGGAKHNEFSMEDGGGGMKVGMTASKDYTEAVNNNKTQKIAVNEKTDVGVDCANTVGGSQKISIGAMQTKTVTSDASVQVTGDRTKSVGAAEMVTVSGAETNKISGSDTESVGACRITTATMGISRSSKGSHSLTVGGAMIEATAMGCSVATAGARSETVGAVKLVASGGAVAETVIGAMAVTVGGVLMNNAAAKTLSSTKGAATIEVGGAAALNAGDQIQITAKSISINVGGVVNILGGGGVLNMTPGSGSFVGLVTLKGSSGVSLSGAPNLVG
jgi:type VI secretion system secreted protein VgrG